jgi:glycine hydroxymethyltransferase
MSSTLRHLDNEVAQTIRKERDRQEQTISLIASESMAPVAVMEASGSVFTNKSVEGYPGARFHGGVKYVDVIEELAIERAKKLFGAEYVNVQPHSGTNANVAVYLAVLQPGDTVLAMNLAHGGHLTHGHPANLTGKFYRFFHYGVNKDTGLIDYDEVEALALKHRPKIIVAGSSAYSRLIDWERLRSIADQVSAHFMVDMAHIAGLVAARVIPSPVPHAQFVTSSTYKTLCGPRGGFILSRREFGPALNRAVFPGSQGSIHITNVAAKATAFKIAMTEEFRQVAAQVVRNAVALAQALQAEGFDIVSGGTDTHLMLLDLRKKGLTGKEAQEALELVGISTNRNLVPFDPQKATITSGLRLGTTPATNRGMKETEMGLIAQMIGLTLRNIGNDRIIAELKEKVLALCRRFPVPDYGSLY